jgi:hypothetical protein
VVSALSGATIDLVGETLYLSPRVGSDVPELHMPIFLSRTWLWLDYVPADRTLRITVTNTFGREPVVIRALRADGDTVRVTLPRPFVLRPGATLDLSHVLDRLRAQQKPAAVEVESPKPGRIHRDGLPAAKWRAVSGRAGGKGKRVGAAQAYDGYPETRWTTMRPMQPGDWYRLDLGEVRAVRRIVLDSANSPGDYPRGYRVEVSADAQEWCQVATATETETTARQVTGIVTVDFPPASARYLRVTQLGRHQALFWSIHELYVYE